MKLLVIGDIHGHLDYLIDLESLVGDCDGIVIAGDITDFGGGYQARTIISSLSGFGKPLLAVPGNCDLEGAADELQREHINLHGRHLNLGDLQFVGVGGSVPTGGANAESGEDTFRRILQQSIFGLASTENLVLVTHQPAYGVRVDQRDSGHHGGSRAVLEFIEEYQPILAISGHIHEAYGIDQLGTTVLLNPGPFRCGHYAVARIENGQVRIELFP